MIGTRLFLIEPANPIQPHKPRVAQITGESTRPDCANVTLLADPQLDVRDQNEDVARVMFDVTIVDGKDDAENRPTSPAPYAWCHPLDAQL